MHTSYEPELYLEPQERAALALVTSSQGWAVFHKIARWTVDQYILALINVKSGDTEVLEGHRVAKTSASFYETLTRTVNREVELYVTGKREDGPPVDATEGMIDLGPLASRQEDIYSSEEGMNEFD